MFHGCLSDDGGTCHSFLFRCRYHNLVHGLLLCLHIDTHGACFLKLQDGVDRLVADSCDTKLQGTWRKASHDEMPCSV